MKSIFLKLSLVVLLFLLTSCAKEEFLTTVKVTKIETAELSESKFIKLERVNTSEYIAATINGSLFYSSDNGDNWIELPETPFSGHSLIEFHFATPDTGFAIAVEDDFSKGVLYKTTDKGMTWNSGLLSSNKDVISVSFSSGNNGFCLTSTQTYWTSNGGESWNNNSWPNIEPDTDADKIYALSKDTAITISNLDFSYFMTFNGGKNWTEEGVWSGYLNKGAKLFLLGDVLYGINSAGKVLRSPDRGETWPNILSMSDNCEFPLFGLDINNEYGIAVGNNTILVSRDGGDSWTYKLTQDGESFPGQLIDVKFIQEKTAIAIAFGTSMYKIEITE